MGLRQGDVTLKIQLGHLMIKPFTPLVSGMALAALIGIAGCGAGSSATTVVDATQTLSNLKSANIALGKYGSAHDQILPVAQNAAELKALLLPYLTDPSVLEDPVTHVPFMWNSSFSGKSYASLGDFTSTAYYGDIARVVPFYVANPPDIDARPVVTISGKAKLVTDAEWKLIKIVSQIP